MAKRNPDGCLNAALSGPQLGLHAGLNPQLLDRWEQAVNQRKLSARSGIRVLRVARSLADLADQPHIGNDHLAQALCFRSFDLGMTD